MKKTAGKELSRDERLEIVLMIEGLIDGQPGISELIRGLEGIQNRLLGDPSGNQLAAIHADRVADYWEKSGRREAVEMTEHFRAQARSLRGKI